MNPTDDRPATPARDRYPEPGDRAAIRDRSGQTLAPDAEVVEYHVMSRSVTLRAATGLNFRIQDEFVYVLPALPKDHGYYTDQENDLWRLDGSGWAYTRLHWVPTTDPQPTDPWWPLQRLVRP